MLLCDLMHAVSSKLSRHGGSELGIVETWH